MRKRSLGGVTAALLVGLGAAVATTRGGEYYEETTPQAEGLLSGLIHEKPRKSANNAKNGRNVSEVKPPPVATVETDAALEQRQRNAWFRRMEVCQRLREIANQTGNDALWQQAEELEERANALYRQQTSRMPQPSQMPLTVLADDSQNPARERPKAENAQLLHGRASGSSLLGGNPNQRQQAVLNGSNRGGN